VQTGPASLFRYSRAYQLMNTRYFLGPATFETYWNQRLPKTPVQIITRFDIGPKSGFFVATNLDQLTAIPDPDGLYAVMEYDSALPRAKLYSHWQVNTNDSDTLEQTFSPDFDPENNVLVSGGVPDDSSTNAPTPPDDAVQFVSYAPKDIVLKADAAAPSVLLLNDHFHPDWKVLVDGAPEKLLRCNYLLRGVYLLPGAHTVEFKFQPRVGLLYVSLTAVIIALATLGVYIALFIKSRPPAPAPVTPPPAPQPAPMKPNPSKTGSRKKSQRK
jgi:hypothetical protein